MADVATVVRVSLRLLVLLRQYAGTQGMHLNHRLCTAGNEQSYRCDKYARYAWPPICTDRNFIATDPRAR